VSHPLYFSAFRINHHQGCPVLCAAAQDAAGSSECMPAAQRAGRDNMCVPLFREWMETPNLSRVFLDR